MQSARKNKINFRFCFIKLSTKEKKIGTTDTINKMPFFLTQFILIFNFILQITFVWTLLYYFKQSEVNQRIAYALLYTLYWLTIQKTFQRIKECLLTHLDV